jgi:hypothetical protein
LKIFKLLPNFLLLDYSEYCELPPSKSFSWTYREYYFYGTAKRKMYILYTSAYTLRYTTSRVRAIYANDCIIRKTTYFVPFCGRLIGIAYCIGNNMQYTKTTTTTTTATTTRNYTHVLCVLRRPAHTASYYCSRTRRDTNFVMASSNCDVRRQTNKRPDSADAFIVICRCLYAYDTAPQAY